MKHRWRMLSFRVGTEVEITLPMIASDRDIPNREALV